MPSLLGTTVAANYLVVKQSPGAALNGVNAEGDAPLLTFSTPNLRMFRVVVSGTNVDLAASSEAADSQWSRVVRALQVTSELFAVFAPSATTFCFMAPDFNTNAGAPTTASDPLSTPTFSVVEAAIAASLQSFTGGANDAAATVSYVSLTGTTVS